MKLKYNITSIKLMKKKNENSHKIFNEKSGIFKANLSLSFLD